MAHSKPTRHSPAAFAPATLERPVFGSKSPRCPERGPDPQRWSWWMANFAQPRGHVVDLAAGDTTVDTGGEVTLVVTRPSEGRRTMSNGSGRSGCRSPSLRSAPG